MSQDVIITDIQMPFMTGLEFIEKVREEYPGKEIVIFSGFGEFEYARQAIRLGVKEYILKPVDKEEMMTILKKIKRTLDQSFDRLRDIRQIQENYQEKEALQKKKFYQEWVQRTKMGKETLAASEKRGILILKAGPVGRGILKHPHKRKNKREWQSISAWKSCSRMFSRKIMPTISISRWEKEIGVCFALKKEHNLKVLLKTLDCLVKDGEKLFSFVITVRSRNREKERGTTPDVTLRGERSSWLPYDHGKRKKHLYTGCGAGRTGYSTIRQ